MGQSKLPNLILVSVLGVVLGLFSKVVMAEETEESQWDFTAAPYIWFTSLQGDVATIPGIPPADVDASFGDLWDNTNLAAMGYFEARNGRWGIGADLVYFDLTADGGGPTNAFSGTEMDLKAFIATFGPFYRAAAEKDYSVDVMAGARTWVTDTRLSLSAGTLPGRSADAKENWVDPVIGARGAFALDEHVSLRGYADVGGFGVSSDITYQLMGLVSYSFNDWITGELGYRFLHVDYSNDAYKLDANFHGPLLGVRFLF